GREVDELREKRFALLLVSADGEEFLQLVDRKHEPLAAVKCGWLQVGVLAGPSDELRPALASGQDAGFERGREPRLQDGGFAASRRPDDPDARRGRQPRDERGDEALAAEEVLGVSRGKRGEALERADDDRFSGLGGATRPRLVFERRVLAQDGAFELLKRAARLEAELVAQQLARVAV